MVAVFHVAVEFGSELQAIGTYCDLRWNCTFTKKLHYKIAKTLLNILVMLSFLDILACFGRKAAIYRIIHIIAQRFVHHRCMVDDGQDKQRHQL